MKKKDSIFSGIVALLVSQVIVKIFGLVYKLYLANKSGFGDAGNAIYNSGYQIYALLLTVSSIGVPNAVAKLVAENKHNSRNLAEVLKSALVLFSIIGVVGSVCLGFFSKIIANNWLNIPEARESSLALSPAIFNVCIVSVLRGYFNGINEVSITAKSQTVEQILKTIFTFILVEIAYIVTFANTKMMAAFANFATTLATLGSFIYIYRKNNLKFLGVKCKIRKIFKILYIAVPISLSSILASLNRNIDSVTIVRYLKNFMGESLAKIEYGILSGKIDVISAVPVSFIIAIATTIIPVVAEKNKQSRYNELNSLVQKYFKYTLLIAFPCSVCMIVFSDQILNFLFGSCNGSLLLKISASAIVFISLEQVINSVLQGIGKIFVPASALAVGVTVKIILNMKLLGLSPYTYWYGGTAGCCIATLACHVVAFSIGFFVMNKNLKLKLNFFDFLLKPMVASCIMATSLYYTFFLLKGIIAEKIAIILAGIVAVIIYIILIFLLKILTKEEISYINIQKCQKNEKK